MMVSLAELWKSVGVNPDAVIGHSQGEIAAAYVAGALSLRDAARVVTLRSKLLTSLAGPGGMLSIACGTERARELLAPYGNRVSIAAVNGRSAVVVSGEVAALDELVGFCADLELRTRRIDVDYASHSVEVEAIRGDLAEVLSGIEPRSSRIAFFSTVTGNRLDTAGLDADYWYRNIRQTVQFDQAVRGACEHGYRTFIESSPHPALVAGIEDTVNDHGGGDSEAIVIPTLGRDDGGLERFLTSAATAFVAGVSVVWRGALDGAGFVELPTYAFDRRRFWLSGEGIAADASGLGPGHQRAPATERGRRAASLRRGGADGSPVAEPAGLAGRSRRVRYGRVPRRRVSWSLAIRAGDEVGCSTVDELTLQAPLMLPAKDSGSASVAVQVVVGPAEESGQRTVSIFSRPDTGSALGVPRRRNAEHRLGRAGRGSVGMAAGGSRQGRCGRRLRAVGGAWLRLRPGIQGTDRDVGARRRGVRRGAAARRRRRRQRVRGAPGVAGCGHARSDRSATKSPARPTKWCCRSHGRACRCMPRARRRYVRASRRRRHRRPLGQPPGGLDRAGRRARIAGAVGARDGGAPGERAAAACGGVGLGPGPAVRAGLVAGRDDDRAATEPPAHELFESVAAEEDPVSGSYERTHRALAAVQSWLTEHDSGVLIVATRGAMGLAGEDVTDLAGAAVWGLVRSAQTEHPGRIVLVDSDAALDDNAIATVLAVGEPAVLLRDGTAYIARVHGSRAVDGIMTPPGRRTLAARVSAARAPSKTCNWSRFPTPAPRWSRARFGWPCAPSPPTSATS